MNLDSHTFFGDVDMGSNILANHFIWPIKFYPCEIVTHTFNSNRTLLFAYSEGEM